MTYVPTSITTTLLLFGVDQRAGFVHEISARSAKKCEELPSSSAERPDGLEWINRCRDRKLFSEGFGRRERARRPISSVKQIHNRRRTNAGETSFDGQTPGPTASSCIIIVWELFLMDS